MGLQALISEGAVALEMLEASRLESALTRLVRELNAALAAGRVEVFVPARLAGGRFGWSARCGVVRAQLGERLDALLHEDRIDRDTAHALVVRYGLEGSHGTARLAREFSGLERQATTNRVNAALSVIAADVGLHPLAPVDAPDLAIARREAIVVSVLAQLMGRHDERPIRNYIHARIRSDILGHQIPRLGGAGDTTGRQRWHRALGRWEARVAHHLDQNTLAAPPFLARPAQASLAALDGWLGDEARDVRGLPDDIFAALLHFLVETRMRSNGRSAHSSTGSPCYVRLGRPLQPINCSGSLITVGLTNQCLSRCV